MSTASAVVSDLSEGDVARACDKLAEDLSWTVERYEQRRRTKITEGLPDRRYVQRARALRIWVELKAPGEKLSMEQHAWLLSELVAGALATVIDDDAQLQALFRILGRSGSIAQAEAHRRCSELVALTAARGYRRDKARRRRAAAHTSHR